MHHDNVYGTNPARLFIYDNYYTYSQTVISSHTLPYKYTATNITVCSSTQQCTNVLMHMMSTHQLP